MAANNALGVCGLCGRDPQELEAKIAMQQAEIERLTRELNLAREIIAERDRRLKMSMYDA